MNAGIGGGRRLEILAERLWPGGAVRDAWMIVDCARDSRIYGLLLDSYLRYSCLYSGALPPELERVAPHLVQLDREDGYSLGLMQQAWGHSWGIVLRCDLSLDRLRRHLRTLLTVRDERGRRLLFRYYDPRVLRLYLPTCSAEELRTVFGPVRKFWMEDETPEVAIEFALDGGRLLREDVSLA